MVKSYFACLAILFTMFTIRLSVFLLVALSVWASFMVTQAMGIHNAETLMQGAVWAIIDCTATADAKKETAVQLFSIVFACGYGAIMFSRMPKLKNNPCVYKQFELWNYK